MFLNADGINNRLGQALALVSTLQRPKIRVENKTWMQGLTRNFCGVQGRNYRLTTQEKDELVMTCQKILKKNDSTDLSVENAKALVQNLKEIIMKVIPVEYSSENSIKINRNSPIDFYEIEFNKKGSLTTSIMIPIDKRVAKKSKVVVAFSKAGISEEHITKLIEDLKNQGVTSEKDLIAIAKEIQV